MGERTKYESGTFSWADLATTDPDGAKSFYAGLFGWECEDLPVGEGGTYTMCRLDGKNVAALSGQRDEDRAQGVPPHWNNYVTVDDLDERASRVAELNGNLMMPPFDVMDVGRMAVATDPPGAVFMLWEPRSNIGAEVVNAPGALSWNELATTDVEAAKKFYEGLFGWTYEDMDMNGAGTYTIIRNGDRSNGGIRAQGPDEEGIPPNWLPYFGAVSVDESTGRANKLGGRVIVPTMRVPAGAFAGIADPQGAAFSLFEGDFDD
jgi:predicted enzyme related to lactoylglutathione lyase